MNELSNLGMILLMALLAGHLVKLLRVPEVTGYILAGLIIGPSGLRMITDANLAAIGVFSEVALGLILFSIGAIFHFEKFRSIGRNVLLITFTESTLVGGLLFIAMTLLGQSWQIASLLAVIGMETAAASTLMVMRECNAEGPLTETLVGVIAVNNVLCLTVFTVVSGIVSISAGMDGSASIAATVYDSTYRVLWQIVGSAALGYVIGFLLATWGAKVVEPGEMLILLIGSILLCVGVALLLRLSTLVATLAVGATAANISPESRRLFRAQSHTAPPFYAIFFVIAGANLHVGLLKSIGGLGVAYLLVRAAGKFIGSRIGIWKSTLPARVGAVMPLALMAHAGLAIGLVLTVSRRFPELGEVVSTVVLSAVLIYEVIGPFGAKFAIESAGEARREPVPLHESTI